MLVTPIIPISKNSFVATFTKVDSLEHCVVSYDLKDILMLRELHDVNQVDP